MRIILTSILLIASITSVFASDFQWSRAFHSRLNAFVRVTKLPPGQYVIGVYSTGNTITEYTQLVSTPEIRVVETQKVVVETKIVEVPKYIVTERIIYVTGSTQQSDCVNRRNSV